jgi:PEGA domain
MARPFSIEATGMYSRTLKHRVTWLLVLLATLIHVEPARAAQPEDDAAVEKAIQDGIVLRRAGNDEGALTLFLDLERKSPDSVRVLLHVTAAAQATGRWLLAHDYLRKAAAFKNDAYYVRNRAAVNAVEEAVARHVGEFRVLGQPSGAEVRLSGNLLGRLPFKEPVAVELGSYVLEVSKPGFYSLRRDIAISAGGALNQEVVELALSDEPSGVAPVARGGVPAHQRPRPANDREASWWESRAVTWTLAGIAVAGAGTSGLALAIRQQKVARWNDDARCIDRQAVTRSREEACGSERDAANTAGTVAVTSGAVAALFATATLTHWLTTSPRSTAQARREPSASCGAGLASVVCSGTF